MKFRITLCRYTRLKPAANPDRTEAMDTDGRKRWIYDWEQIDSFETVQTVSKGQRLFMYKNGSRLSVVLADRTTLLIVPDRGKLKLNPDSY